MYRVYISRIFTRGQKHEFEGGFGVHAMNVSAFLESDGLTPVKVIIPLKKVVKLSLYHYLT